MTTFNGPAQPIVPLLLGHGKLARHLHYYFHLIGFNHKHFDDARDLKNPELLRKLKGTNAIWILTSDRSIAEVKTNLEYEMKKEGLHPDDYLFLHSSAATEIQGMDTIHPLMTFGTELYTLEQYQKIPLAFISSDVEALQERISLPNPHFQIFSAQRALYHAYAVVISNLPILLWSQVSQETKKRTGLRPEFFNPILEQTVKNFIQSREQALTGPIARGDVATIEKNLKALGDSPLGEIYRTFNQIFNPPPKENDDDHRT